jgi:hypothetical protein
MTNLFAIHSNDQPADEERVTVEAIHQMALVLRASWFALPVLALLVVIGMWRQTEHTLLIGWFLCAITMPMMRHLLLRRYFSTTLERKSAHAVSQTGRVAAKHEARHGGQPR